MRLGQPKGACQGFGLHTCEQQARMEPAPCPPLPCHQPEFPAGGRCTHTETIQGRHHPTSLVRGKEGGPLKMPTLSHQEMARGLPEPGQAGRTKGILGRGASKAGESEGGGSQMIKEFTDLTLCD